MAGDFWDPVEYGLLLQLLTGVPYADLTPVKISLHTAEPGGTGANEVVGGSYTRVQVDTDKWTIPVGIGNGSSSYNTEDLVYASMPECNVTHVGMWSNDGTVFMMRAPLDPAQSVSIGATFTILAGKLEVNLN